MKKYEFDFEKIDISEDLVQAAQMNLLSSEASESLSNKIKILFNQRGKDGWEPVFPIFLPLVWFKREYTGRRKV